MYNGGDGSNNMPYESYDHPNNHVSSTTQSRVKVEDALSYLDQVKTQFLDQPVVYTQFLDIMKDFKSQAIDTPGVITRVSVLFHGRPALIMGFNTFLPPGFEVKVEGARITIREPTGSIRIIAEGNGAPTQHEMDALREAEEADEDEEEDGELDEEQDMDMLPPESEDEPTPDPTPAEMAMIQNFQQEHHTLQAPQGVQLNTAIGYVNKIKARFVDRPSVYKDFLEILHNYQGQISEQTSTPHTEESVLQAVSTLFADEPDLLTDFRLFLPDVHGLSYRPAPEEAYYSDDEPTERYMMDYQDGEECDAEFEQESTEDEEEEAEGEEGDEQVEDEEEGEEREPSVESQEETAVESSSGEEYDVSDFPVPMKDQDIHDIVSNTAVEELAFFDKIRRSISQTEHDTFLRTLNLYTASVISAAELLTILQPVIGGYPYLLNEMRLKFFPGEEDEERPAAAPSPDQISAELRHQIDYASCKQLGISYRSLPENYQPPMCTGRTPMCKQVLNDTWVSYPSWSSEDSSCVSSKKTQYEDFVYRTEDERFELDIIIEVNKYAIETLEGVKRKMNRMSTLEQEKYRLDEKLGATSASLMHRAIKRIYGEHAAKLTEGLKKNPLMTVHKVIERMREKEREWSESQNHMNRIWREQNEKHMVRAMDHQATALKAGDAKWIKAKQMIAMIEQQFDDRQQKSEDGLSDDVGPHMVLTYPEDRSVLHDASKLIIHFVKRQSNIHKEEKKKIKRLLRRQVTEWMLVENEDMSDTDDDPSSSKSEPKTDGYTDDYKEDVSLIGTARSRMIYGGNALFVFIRTHQVLCDRLGKIKKRYNEMVEEYVSDEEIRKQQWEIYQQHGRAIHSHEHNASDICNGLSELKNLNRNPVSYYEDMMTEIKNLLDSQIEPNAFEDNMRLIFPMEGYLMFTIDKLVSVIARQLHQLVTDGDGCGTLRMYAKYRVERPFSTYDLTDRRRGIEGEYAAAAETQMNCQNCFRVFVINEDKPHVTIELVDTETGDNVDEDRIQQNARQLMERSNSVMVSSDEDEEQEENDDSSDAGPSTVENERSTAAVRSENQKPYRRQPRAKRTQEPGRAKLFLRRNLSSEVLANRSNIAKLFATVDSTVVVSSGRIRMVNRSFEGMIKKNRPDRQTVMEDLARMNAIRRHRAGDLMPVAQDSIQSWLSIGMARVVVRHPQYSFLVYNRYFTKNTTLDINP